MTVPKVILNKDNNPGRAFWCTEHPAMNTGGRLECTKLKRVSKVRCHMPAVRGTNACIRHGGHRREVMEAKGQAQISAWSAIGEAAKPIDSGMAVMGMLQQSWLRAHAYGELLRQQVVKDGLVAHPDQFDPDGIIETDGLIGYRYGAAGKEGIIYRVSEDVRALVMLEAQERDRVVRYAETAHKMGISERLTGLAERWGDMVVGRIMLVIDALSLTPEQEAMVPALIQAHLGQLEITATGHSEKSS